MKVKFPISGTSQIIVKSFSTGSPFVKRPGKYLRPFVAAVVAAVDVVAVVVVVVNFQSREPQQSLAHRSHRHPRLLIPLVLLRLLPPLLLQDLPRTFKKKWKC